MVVAVFTTFKFCFECLFILKKQAVGRLHAGVPEDRKTVDK